LSGSSLRVDYAALWGVCWERHRQMPRRDAVHVEGAWRRGSCSLAPPCLACCTGHVCTIVEQWLHATAAAAVPLRTRAVVFSMLHVMSPGLAELVRGVWGRGARVWGGWGGSTCAQTLPFVFCFASLSCCEPVPAAALYHYRRAPSYHWQNGAGSCAHVMLSERQIGR